MHRTPRTLKTTKLACHENCHILSQSLIASVQDEVVSVSSGSAKATKRINLLTYFAHIKSQHVYIIKIKIKIQKRRSAPFSLLPQAGIKLERRALVLAGDTIGFIIILTTGLVTITGAVVAVTFRRTMNQGSLLSKNASTSSTVARLLG